MKVTNTVYIEVPTEFVWFATADVESWPNWSPNFQSVQLIDSGELRVGNKARIKQQGLPSTDWRVNDYQEGEHFSWNTTVLGLRVRATHIVSEIEGGTRSQLDLSLSGVFSAMIWPILKPLLTTALRRENNALRLRSLELRSERELQWQTN